MRLRPELQRAVDSWIAKQADPKPSRPEAIRSILSQFLGLRSEPVPTIEEKIADTKERLAEIDVPAEPSPERGMALLRKGAGENKLRRLKARRSPKLGK